MTLQFDAKWIEFWKTCIGLVRIRKSKLTIAGVEDLWDCQAMVFRATVLSRGLVASTLAVDPVGDFSLPDVNDTSPRSAQEISPRDYMHQVTAYYFGSAN